ncbi:AMP-binding protein [Noviherbaspirillum autotrophicum]|uniref:Long-chain-fatty-acid--CoA ligase n=1 Tax=Noviherbaspirillum autotrophicum TaxID=709839 RepID=A0A0C1YRG6_9BURK|nr:AMP-binding protein [Noviherbaspirillum autotrophicum]KIF83262.1 long-chain fatty acid--CoA ligase [Noviherbaspirillum autotrophicum]
METSRPWLTDYPPGVPAEIELADCCCVNQMFETACRQYADLPAFTNMGHTLTYADLERLSRAFAAFLQSLPGMEKGARIALMMPNLLQYPVAIFGALRAGLIVVNVNPLYTERELEHQLKDCGACAIVVLENFASKVQKVLAATALRHVIVTGAGDMLGLPRRLLVNFAVRHVRKMVPPWSIAGAVSWRHALRAGATMTPPAIGVGRDDIAFLQYTGGTTGVSKGVILSHANVVANVLQCRAWIGGTLREREEIVLTPLPLYHVFSLVANCLTFMTIGGLNVLITNPKDLPAFVKTMRAYPWTVMTGVNTLYNALANTPGFGPDCARSAKLSIGAGAAMLRPVMERWTSLVKGTMIEGYGLSEATAGVCINPPHRPRLGAVGIPIPSTEVRIRRDDGSICAPDEAGEIEVRGPQVMRGYWNRPAETADALSPEGWLRTGDIGTMDADGWVSITDRKKDMIIVSGFNVYPAEIEAVVAAHPGVLEAAAVGSADAHSGEAVKLFVVRKDPQLSEHELLAYCRANLTGYKIPRQIEFRAELPKTPIGKILRRELRGG